MVAAGGAAATAAAMVLPWAAYGDTSIGLIRLPSWEFYVAAAVTLNLVVGWSLLRPSKGPRFLLTAGVAMCVATIGAAATVMMRYDDSGAIFDGIVPLVMPALSLGGPVAIGAALVSGAALLRCSVVKVSPGGRAMVAEAGGIST